MGGILCYVDDGNVYLGMALIGLALPFLYVGFNTATSIEIDDEIRVNCLWKTRSFPLSEIESFQVKEELSNVSATSRQSLLGGTFREPTRYPVGVFRFRSGRKVKFLLLPGIENRIRSKLAGRPV